MAELGCDYPEITLKLDRNYLPAGEMLTGSFFFWPEILEGTNNPIELEFVLLAQFEHEVKESIIDVLKTEEFIVSDDAGAVEVPFRYQLPQCLPVSTHAIRYYLRPKLSDKHITNKQPGARADSFFGLPAIIVQPNQLQKEVMDALFSLGYQEKPDSRFWDGAAQEFDFFASHDNPPEVNEFTLTFQPQDETMLISLQYTDQDTADLQFPVTDGTAVHELLTWLIDALQNPNS
jgi:hypothetical protein